MAKTTSLKAKDPQSLTTNVLALDFSADAGMGMEGADKSAFAIPFVSALQGLSPQLETVEGARPGLFINTITNELFKEVLVVPCAYQRRFLRWAPREQGGGYKGELNPIDVETGALDGLGVNEKGQPTLEGDQLKDTRNHFVLVKSESGVWQPALISLTSTQIKKSKRWMSRIQGIEMRAANGTAFNPPSFSHVYKLTTKKEENSQGSWWGVEIDLVGPVGDLEVYQKAKAFHQSVVAGTVEVVHPTQDEEENNNDNSRF